MVDRADRRLRIRDASRVALGPAAALAVHQLRYWLAFGGGANAALARQGHSYLHSVVPWIILLAGVAVGGFLSALGRAAAGQRSAPRFTLSLLGLWLLSATCLVAIFAGQEFLEGLFATGHPAGLAGIFGFGGWWAIPAAICVGLVLAVVFHGARWVLDEIAARCAGTPNHAASSGPEARQPLVLPPRLSPLAEGRSGRGPPV